MALSTAAIRRLLAWPRPVRGYGTRVLRDYRTTQRARVADAMHAGARPACGRAHAFSFKNRIHREHTTWALTITPHPLRSAGALSADLQALVIQVLHVPDTPRPVRSRVISDGGAVVGAPSAGAPQGMAGG